MTFVVQWILPFVAYGLWATGSSMQEDEETEGWGTLLVFAAIVLVVGLVGHYASGGGLGGSAGGGYYNPPYTP